MWFRYSDKLWRLIFFSDTISWKQSHVVSLDNTAPATKRKKVAQDLLCLISFWAHVPTHIEKIFQVAYQVHFKQIWLHMEHFFLQRHPTTYASLFADSVSVFANVIHYFYEDCIVKRKEKKSKYCFAFLWYNTVSINTLWIIIV